jgi:hypothetical protein
LSCDRSIVTATVVVSRQLVVRTHKSKLLVKATIRMAIYLAALAIEMFKVQFDYFRMVNIGRKVVSGAGCHPAHVNDRVSYFRRKTVNVSRIPGFVVRKSTSSCECARLTTKHEQQDARCS